MTETQLSLLGLLISFIGGGTVSAILNWIRSNRAEFREREAKYLELQLIKLYGPLYNLTLQNKKMLEIEREFREVYKTEYIDTQYSDDQRTRELVSKEANKTIELQNKYISLIIENNRKIKELLDSNFVYLDTEDVDPYLNFFYEHYTRYQTEIDEQGLVTPFSIYQQIGDVSFVRPEFMESVEKKYKKKKIIFEGS